MAQGFSSTGNSMNIQRASFVVMISLLHYNLEVIGSTCENNLYVEIEVRLCRSNPFPNSTVWESCGLGHLMHQCNVDYGVMIN
uniref:Uncharacterized protein n=1 Tax=Rhizophora mucronata TaxID=61149 RepID=A0A2P2NTK4_RHIMU